MSISKEFQVQTSRIPEFVQHIQWVMLESVAIFAALHVPDLKKAFVLVKFILMFSCFLGYSGSELKDGENQQVLFSQM